MSNIEDLLSQLVAAMSGIQDTLTEISGKLDDLNGVYGIQDIVTSIDEGVRKIVGPAGFDLTDIHQELVSLGAQMGNDESLLGDISRKLDNLDGVYGLDDVVATIESGVKTLTGSTGYDLTDIHKELQEIAGELAEIKFKVD